MIFLESILFILVGFSVLGLIIGLFLLGMSFGEYLTKRTEPIIIKHVGENKVSLTNVLLLILAILFIFLMHEFGRQIIKDVTIICAERTFC